MMSWSGSCPQCISLNLVRSIVAAKHVDFFKGEPITKFKILPLTVKMVSLLRLLRGGAMPVVSQSSLSSLLRTSAMGVSAAQLAKRALVSLLLALAQQYAVPTTKRRRWLPCGGGPRIGSYSHGWLAAIGNGRNWKVVLHTGCARSCQWLKRKYNVFLN